jgi:hypothetical protein
VDIGAMRIGVREGFHAIKARFQAGERFSSVILPTRYGKSDLIRCSALDMYSCGLVAVSMVWNPSELLRDQIVSPEKMNAWIARYKINKRGVKAGKLTRLPSGVLNPNREFLLSSTIQFGQRNVDIFGEAFNELGHRTGLPSLAFVDESHTGSEDNTWGEFVTILAETYGLYVVVVTASAIRSDGRIPVGFRAKRTNVESTAIHTTRPHEDPRKIWVDRYEGEKCEIEVEADYELTFAQAWAEDPPVLLQIDHFPFDVRLRDVNGCESGDDRLLSELSKDETRKVLGKIVRDARVIRMAVVLALEALRIYRQSEIRATLIIFCGNDSLKNDEKEFNKHANQIREEIEAVDRSLNVVIATHADGNGKAKIEDFTGDVLIVKQMASLGLDKDHLMVGLDLSTTRTISAMLQRYNRISTLFGPFEFGHMISPADCLTAAFFDTFVAKHGGGKVVENLTLTESYVKDIEEKARKIYVVEGVEGADFRDTKLNEADGIYHETARRLFQTCPKLARIMSRAEAMTTFKANGMTIISSRQDSDEIVCVDQELEDLYIEINEYLKNITMSRIGHYDRTPEKQAQFRDTIKAVNKAGRIRAAVRLDPELREIRDLQELTRFRDELIKMPGAERDPS